MKNCREIVKLNTKGLLLMLSFLLFVSPQSMAQNESVDDTAPPPENEIVCFAAKKKWVCAPANERQKAHDKAMKLAIDNDAETIEPPLDDNVQIQTLQPSGEIQPISEPVINPGRINQAVIEEQIKDFTPRVATENEPTETIVEPETISPTPTEVTSDVNEVLPVETTQSAPTEPITTDNNFNSWKKTNPESWSFQVIGTSNRHHLDDFIQSNGLSQMPHAIVRTQANGADWWVVLAGLYASRDEAINRRQELPSQLASNAWVRQVKAIVGEAD